MTSGRAFLASTNGFKFTNSWPSEPAVSLATPFGPINVGNADSGLCGGMVFAALDYWYATRSLPVDQPPAGTPLYDFLVKRIVDSWNVPVGIAQYFTWMNLPDADTSMDMLGTQVTIDRGVSSRTCLQQWPQIRQDLDQGRPSPLGIVTVRSSRLEDLSQNHQVLAYAYTIDAAAVTLRVYDPNQGQDDTVTIGFDLSRSSDRTLFTNTLGIGHDVRGFFRSRYVPMAPPGPTNA